MTCASVENDLALHVERDLSDAAVPAVEAHLRECGGCRAFLDGLGTSQSLVKDLAAEAIDPEALADVRARVVAASASASRSAGPRGRSPRPAVWAVAAAVALAAAGLVVWLAMASRVASRGPSVAVGPAPVAAVPSVPAPPQRSLGSTPRALPRVSPHMGRPAVARAPVDQPPAVAALSVDDADQLARAVVAMSRIRSVEVVEPDGEPPSEPTPSIRIATADPDVVIYWRLDSNGGR